MSDFNRDSDVLTSNDFKALEDKEDRFSFVKKMFKKNTDSTSKKSTSAEQLALKPSIEPKTLPLKKQIDNEIVHEIKPVSTKLDQLELNFEKQSGKFEIENDEIKSLDERLIDYYTQLGELRSIIILKEKSFSKIELEFESIKEVVKDIKPEVIQKKFKKQDDEFIKIDSVVERMDTRFQMIEDELAKFNRFMAKFGGYEHLLGLLKRMDEKVKVVSQIDNNIEKNTAKVNGLFEELNDKINNMTELESKFDALESNVSKISSDLDSANGKLKNKVSFDAMKDIEFQLEVLKKNMMKNDFSLFKSFVKKEGATPRPSSKLLIEAQIEPDSNSVIPLVTVPSPDPKHEPVVMGVSSISNLDINSKSLDEDLAKAFSEKKEYVKKVLSFAKLAKSKGVLNEPLVKKLKANGWNEGLVEFIVRNI